MTNTKRKTNTSSYIPAVVTSPLHVMEDGCIAASEGWVSRKKNHISNRTSGYVTMPLI